MKQESTRNVIVVGGGVLGLWQALLLARCGARVRLLERDPEPFKSAASQYAGAMIAPDCEAEEAPEVIRNLGYQSAALWHDLHPGLIKNGTLVLAPPRDQGELRRFARATTGHVLADQSRIDALEPELGGRFASGLYFANEAHMTTPDALDELLSMCRTAGVDIAFGVAWADDAAAPDRSSGGDSWTIDCRGFAAVGEVQGLRGVRGERMVLRAPDVQLLRPVRLLHPRHPLYVVPWSDQRFLVGATVIESADQSAITVRSALELLGLAYTLHPGFGEAEILEMTAGVRPSLPDNVPAIRVAPQRKIIRVNGAYRHGFLMAPILARGVADYLKYREPRTAQELISVADE